MNQHALTTGTVSQPLQALARRKRICVGGPFDQQYSEMHIEASRTTTIRADGFHGFYRVTKTTLIWVDLQH